MEGRPTADPDVVIEEEIADHSGPNGGWSGYVRYRHRDGRRWDVCGTCDRRGDCLIGAVIEGFGTIESHEDIERAKEQLGRTRPDLPDALSDLDVPVGPGFKGCCPLVVTEL